MASAPYHSNRSNTRLLKGILTVAVLFLVGATLLAWLIMGQLVPRAGSRDSAYQVVRDWPKLPADVTLGQVAGVGVDSQDNVFIFRRADKNWLAADFGPEPIAAPTVLLLDGRNGQVIASWGENTFVMPHGLTVDEHDNIWLTDVGLHQVFKYDHDGRLLLAIGEAGVPGMDESHFNRPTDVAVAADGSFYVTDGYINSRVVKFSPDGRFLLAWGASGATPGQFDVPHSITLDDAGQVYIADRGNSRLQIFDGEGNFLAEWQNRRQLGRPWAVRFGADGFLYVVDGGDQPTFLPDRARILKVNLAGQVVDSFGSFGQEPGQFIWPHAIAVAGDGALYIGEVSTGMRVQKFTPFTPAAE